MTDKKHDTKTGEAWKKLYDRLGSEGLLPKDTGEPIQRRRPSALRWSVVLAACVAAAVLAIVSLYVVERSLVPLHNKAGSPTLVSTLRDGSIVWLEENSTLFLPRSFSRTERRVQLEGNAFFEVRGDKVNPFIIETSRATVEVIGTAFHLRTAENGPFELSVSRGEVRVSDSAETGDFLHVTAGEKALFRENRLLKTGSDDSALHWSHSGPIHFKDQTLESIVRFINDNDEGLQVVLSPGLEDFPVTVAFTGEPPHRMVELLCEGLGLNWSYQGDRLIISE